jgi:hypothetical protein
MPMNPGELEPEQWVAYLDLSGGRNTKKDPHALDRNQLAASDNTWMAQGNTIAKRPGSISIPNISAGNWAQISAGNTGLGVGFTAMVAGRFFNQTALVVQGTNNQLAAVPLALPGVSVGVNSWISLGKVSGGVIAAAQLYDPDPTSKNGPDGTLFIVDGVDTPKRWNGPGSPLTPAVVGQLPTKSDGSGNPITPAYVASLNSSLFYAGEPTDPSMVYISNPFLPEKFNQNLVNTTGAIAGPNFVGLPVGRGDGIGGGSITGLERMASAMVVYKQSAIYACVNLGLLGDLVWGASVVSSSVGCVSPRSIVAFDTFHCFLGIDGVYTFDGQYTRKISENNPDLFDGPSAQILNRTTAVGVRYGNRYLIFFDNGGGTGIALGYPNAGAWFDFGKPDNDGYPAVGTINLSNAAGNTNMNVGGIVPLRGPNDLGNFAWADATKDRIGEFGATVNGFPTFADFGVSFTTTLLGKADFFSDIWGQESPEDLKVVDSVHLLMSFAVYAASGQTYTFNGTVYYDQLNLLSAASASYSLPSQGIAAVGTAVVGTAILGLAIGTPAYQHIYLSQPAPASGNIVQFGFTESSIFPWTSLGFLLLINRQPRVGLQSG